MLKKICLFLFLPVYSFGQNAYPADYFRSPIDSQIVLAGNFGEIRPNHFHAGFDIKTNGKEGMPVYAVADGYISRIRISAFGYGKAIYITHPNGFTSVYGHLSYLEGTIGTLCKQVQYQRQSFEIDTALSAELLPVKKGQLIGLSGNTGGSQGPHLHFEIRETVTEKPVNPYFFGYAVRDLIKPKITAVAIYPIGENATVNGKHEMKKIKPIYQKGEFFIVKADSITVNGDIGFGIETYDTESGSTNQNGVFSIELQSGGKRIYYHELEKFSFENARYVNAHIDYADKQKHSTKIQKCYLAKNNQLGIYKDVINNGIINFSDDSVHWIRFIVKDFVGNKTEMMMKVKSKSVTLVSTIFKDRLYESWNCLTENKIEKNDIKISIPANALYNDLIFHYFLRPPSKGMYSEVYKVMNDEVPLQKAWSLSLKPNFLPERLQSKACIALVSEKGKLNYAGGMYKDGYVSTTTKTFGDFAIIVDTIPPKLRPIFKYVANTTANLSASKTIGIKASDNLSGIRKYKATIDGDWVLMEYEFKQDLLFYTFDKGVSAGEHTFYIEVTDDKENTSTLSFKFKK